jgi:hypothetical protein
VNAALPARFPLEVLHRVRNVCLPPVNPSLHQRLVEKRTSGPDERFPFEIFLVPGLFTNEHQTSMGRTVTEDGLSPSLPEITGLAVFRSPARCGEAAIDRERRRRQIGFGAASRHNYRDAATGGVSC